jgi:hypothetical protein
MGIYLTAVGAVLASLLWIFADLWEWAIPKALEEKIHNWKKRLYHSQVIVRLVNKDSISEHEKYAYSLRHIVSKIERELGVPVHVEVEMDRQDIVLTEEEMRYISCLSRSFSEFTWYVREQVECSPD